MIIKDLAWNFYDLLTPILNFLATPLTVFVRFIIVGGVLIVFRDVANNTAPPSIKILMMLWILLPLYYEITSKIFHLRYNRRRDLDE